MIFYSGFVYFLSDLTFESNLVFLSFTFSEATIASEFTPNELILSFDCLETADFDELRDLLELLTELPCHFRLNS